MSSACKPNSATNNPGPKAASLRGVPIGARVALAGAARFAGSEEPALPEIIEDPILRRLMASDGVRLDHLLAIIADARAKLFER